MSLVRQQPLGAAYPVQLPAFEGPLDLLLHMIEVRELDISVISLMVVTDQYLKTLSELEEIEPGALADFLVVASRLLYIKSYNLLPKPRPPIEDEEEASGDALLRQLLEYRRFKAVAASLRGREEAGLRVYVRTAPRPEIERKLDLSTIDLEGLQRALRRVLQRIPVDPPMPRVKTYPITVAEQLENVRAYLLSAFAAGGSSAEGAPRRGVGFEALLSRSASRLEVIVTFLAVLELVKLQEIEVVQDATFGEIQLMPPAREAA
jgi:segregation and condensation protein A